MDLDMVSYNRLTSANKDAIISELLSENQVMAAMQAGLLLPKCSIRR